MNAVWRTVGFAALLLLLVYLLLHSSSPDLLPRRELQAQLREFALGDAELTRDALLARAGLLRNYDALVRDRLNLLNAIGALQQTSHGGTGRAAPALASPIEQLDRALEAKLDDVERFKTGDSLLRNSVAYLSYTIARLNAQPAAARDAAGGDVGELSSGFLRFIQTPTTATSDDFKAVLARLAAVGSPSDDVRVLLAHGSLVADLLPKVVELLQRIEAAPTTAALARLQASVETYSGAAEARAQVFRYLLFFVALVLLGYLTRQFVRLRAYGRDLQRSNAELSREVTERQQAEAALRVSEGRFRAIAESAHDAIITADDAGAIVSWNLAAATIYGYAATEVLATPLQRLIPERLRAAPELLLPPGPMGGTAPLGGQTIASTGLRKDGREFPLEASIGTWTSAQGTFATAIIRDVSARKQLEETAREQEIQLLQANKMTALGTLVSGVAHEINNPNQLVLFNSGLLADTWRDACIGLDAHHRQDGAFTLAGLPYAEMRDATFTLIADLKDGALRIDRIVQDLKDFARPPRETLPGTVDVNAVIGRAARLLAHLIKQRTKRFELALTAQLPAVSGDAQQIEQVCVNLIVNALEALPDATCGVRLATSVQAGGGAVVIEVADEGVGIPPEHLQRLCEPFFTTKQASGGTGLGLSLTFSLLRAHGGQLDFESEPGRGTRAIVTLPTAAPAD